MHRLMPAAAAALLGCVLTAGLGFGQGAAKAPLKATGWGSLSGKVTLDPKDEVPEALPLDKVMAAHGDAKCCLDAKAKKVEKVDNTWLVDKDTRGVANVAVYLKAPANVYFPIHDKDKKRAGKVVLDQPHCQFIPHMAAHFPSYYDGENTVLTGETLEAKNSATVSHNVRGVGNPLKGNLGFNFNIPPGAVLPIKLNPQPLPVLVQCDIHNWMTAKVFVFDHPYYAITKADGTFSIPRVPAGAEITVMAWHEAPGYVLGKTGRTITVEEGKDHKLDFTITNNPNKAK